VNQYEVERLSLKAYILIDNELLPVTPDRAEYMLARRLKTAIMRMVAGNSEYNSLTFNKMSYTRSLYKKGYWERVSFEGRELEYQEIRIAFVCALQLIFGEFPVMTISLDGRSVIWSMPSNRCVMDVIKSDKENGLNS